MGMPILADFFKALPPRQIGHPRGGLVWPYMAKKKTYAPFFFSAKRAHFSCMARESFPPAWVQ
jgi:hypothetical protein